MTIALQKNAGLCKRQAEKIVGGIIDHISDALANGEQVKIEKFGTFLLRDKHARIGRNPKTGVEHVITARRVVAFRPSRSVRKIVF